MTLLEKPYVGRHSRRVPPKWCPGSAAPRSGNRCRVCGEVCAERGYGFDLRAVGAARHRLPAGVPGCEFHGWRFIRWVDGVYRCLCARDEAVKR